MKSYIYVHKALVDSLDNHAGCLPFTFKGGSKGPALLALRNRTDSRGQMSNDSPEGAVGSCNATEERRLDIDEKPLVVQLNWNKDDREGRFVLKNENDAIPAKKAQSNGPEKQEKEGVIQNFKRTLSKKEKKEKKKREKEALRQASDKEERPSQGDDSENSRLAAEVCKDMPETSFTRTISNPEVVMKRRRQQKLEKRIQEFRSSDGRPDSGMALDVVTIHYPERTARVPGQPPFT